MILVDFYVFSSFSSKLLSLAKYEQNIYYIFLLTIILLIYILILPIIKWFISMHSVRLLTYLFSSFLLILSLFFLTLLSEKWEAFLYYLLQMTFESLALFGGVLFIYYLSKNVISRSKTK